MVVHNDTYFLFPSKSGGYWHTQDLSNWAFVTPTGLPLEDYAPMVVVIDQVWYYTAFNTGAMFKTADVYGGTWERVAAIKGYPDPGMLVDDDGKVYMYSGCSSNGNITGVELDPKNNFAEISNRSHVVVPDYKNRGYETGGDNNELDRPPYVEGAWMNKIGSTYFLQYAIPGTQYKTYADGLFVGSAPLGPFSFQPHNPFSFKPTGFVAGAGHSSTFLSPAAGAGYYHIATSTISIRAMFERRVGIFPVSVAADESSMSADTYLGDYPQPLPATAKRGGGVDNIGSGNVPAWMHLTYSKTATASSTLPNPTPNSKAVSYAPAMAFDEDIRTWWSAATGNTGEWLAVDMLSSGAGSSHGVAVSAVQLNFADQNSSLIGARPTPEDAYKYYVEYATTTADVGGGPDATAWLPIPELDMRTNTADRPHAYFELAVPLKNVKHMRITNVHMPANSLFSLYGFRVFGNGNGMKPAPVDHTKVVATRNATDPRRVSVSWAASTGGGDAEFYIVRYGVSSPTAAAALPYNYQVYDGTVADIRALVAGIHYTFAVDAVNANGVAVAQPPTTVADT